MRTRSLPVSGLVVIVALAALAAPAAAQSTLGDNTVVVVTSEGLFRVSNQTTAKLLDPTPFHGALEAPSITWIDGTDHFIVTTKGNVAPPGIWRVTLTLGAAPVVVDLTPTLPAWIGPGFTDADYSPALDVLFLLHRDDGVIAGWAKPATSTLATLAPFGTITPADARSIAIRGARQPFSVLAALESGPLQAVEKPGTEELNDGGGWDDVACQPVTGDIIVVKQVDSIIGILATSSLVINFNVSGLCGPIVAQPADVEWDPVAGRAVAIAAEALPPCAFDGATTGENHVIRLPLTASGGPAGNQPVLLTPAGASGITGKRADIALVRHGGSEVTYWGFPASGAGSSAPVFKHEGALAPGKAAALKLATAPPDAAALLVLGLYPAQTLLQGLVVVPAVQALLPAVTAANGAAQVPFKLPAGATALVGLDVYMQWVVDDTTTPASGDVASSQAAVFTVGVK